MLKEKSDNSKLYYFNDSWNNYETEFSQPIESNKVKENIDTELENKE